MKICYLSDAIQEHTRRWSKYFAENGHTVDLITWNPNHLPDYDPVKLHIINKPITRNTILARIINFPILLLRIKKKLLEIQPDIIHVHSVTSYAWLAMLSGFRPYVLTPWGTDINIEINTSFIVKFFSMLSLRKADLIMCDAKFVKETLIGWGVNKNNIEIIMFGVDFRRIPNEKKRNPQLIKNYNLSDSPIVISTRLLTELRDVESFVRAVPLVTKVIPDVNFVAVGSGAEREKLEAIARSNGTLDSIRFIGHVTEKEMIEWLCTSDIYVSTSLTDAGLSASTAEAMACRLPVIVADNSENSLWVHDGSGGYVYPNKDYEQLAERIIKLLNDKSLRAKCGNYNRKIIKEKNNYSVEMQKVESLYVQTAAHIKRKN